MSKLKGKTITINNNDYIFIKHLKDGGNASIWVAENEGEKYAIKVLGKFSYEKGNRFEKEIDFCKNNNFDNLITIYGSGEIDGKLCYLMPLYESNLAELINENISVEKKFKYIFQICNGIEFLHSMNVIHRDLKPENILINKDKLVLADLGIAHFESSSLTKANDLLANRGYSAPEQKIKGISDNITVAADIFSLGLIINEIFTGKKPEGSNFTLIADIDPWLIKLDELVGECMKQNPIERPSIKEIILEIKKIFHIIEKKINLIKNNLKTDFFKNKLDLEYDEIIMDRIIEQAKYDILTADYFLKNKSLQDMDKYNHNYNCNIHYKVTGELRREYLKCLLKERCKSKFIYESGIYTRYNLYPPLDVQNNHKHKKIYDDFFNFLKTYSCIDGELLKLFSSCCDYHCIEILKDLNCIKKEVEVLDDAPILYIVIRVLEKLGKGYELSIENDILVNWSKSIFCYNTKEKYMQLFREEYQEEVEEIEKILKEFKLKFNPIITKKNKYFIVRFEDKKSYNHFKDYAINLAKPYFVFEGDVLALVKIKYCYDGIIELYPMKSFEIMSVVARILGLKEI